MKKNLRAHSLSLTVLLLLTILFALVVASIRQLNWLTPDSYDITIVILSMIAFLATGLFLGYNVEKHGFFHALIFAGSYLIIIFLILFLGHDKGLNTKELLINLARAVILLIGSIVGRNLRGY